LQSLADAGLDLSALDVPMVCPEWDTGNGAVYRPHNVEISQPFPYLCLFEYQVNNGWPMSDGCGGTRATAEMDDADHGLTAQFVIGATPTVMGFKPADDSGIQFDASL